VIKTVCGGLCKIPILVNLTLFVKLSGFALNLSGSDSSAIFSGVINIRIEILPIKMVTDM
jgi:hypothetical protein